VFSPVLAKPSKSFNLIDTLSVGVDRIQRNFEPLQRQGAANAIETAVVEDSDWLIENTPELRI
jgi:hypothetical protein